MKITPPTLSALAALLLSLTACMDAKDALDTPDSKSEKTSSSTDSKGTVTQNRSSTEIETDESGRSTTVVKSKTTEDPKGMFNKTTTSQSRKETLR